MKKTINIFATLFLVFLFLMPGLKAQENIIKLGVPQLAWGSINISYEGEIFPTKILHISANVQAPISLDKRLPGDILHNWNKKRGFGQFLDGGQAVGFDITPELRLYQGDVPSEGYYIAPLFRFSGYFWEMPYLWQKTSINKNAYMTSNANTYGFAVGASTGYQWIFNNFTVELHLGLGMGMGFASGTIEVFDSPDLSSEVIPTVTIEIKDQLQDSFDVMPMTNINLKADRNFIRGKGTFPWPMIRTGINVGIIL